MKSKDFLRSKGILSNDSDHYIINFHDGREINLGDLLEEYAQQSQPSGMRWVRASDPPKNSNPVYIRYKHAEGYAKTLGRYCNGVWEWCDTEIEAIYPEFVLTLEWLDESSPAGAAEGASEGISKIREVMNWISQCVDEDHDLEVSEIKMIWNDLSDAILLIKSTPHSGEGMAEALRLKWITLTEDMGRMLSGQRGVSIDKLNKVMNLVQEFVNTLPASLSSPGSGWVNLVDELPNYGTIDVWVSDEYSKRRIPNSEYRQRDFYNKSDRFEAFMHTDDGMRWVDITNMVTHWRPLPAPPGVEDNQTKCYGQGG